MNTKKFLMGTLAGGITSFLLGYLIYGLVLAGFFSHHSIAPSGTMKPMSDIKWWALILGNLASGALLTYIFLKIAKIASFAGGVRTGGVIGFFLVGSFDLTQYATANMFDHTALAADVVMGTAMVAIVGGVVAVVLGMGAKKA